MLSKVESFPRMFAVAVLVTAVLFSVAYGSAARADDDEDSGKQPAVISAKWASECGACHVAYPARYLPAESWRAIMAGLDRHFGSDASMDAESVKEITAFLESNASTRKHEVTKNPQLRITDTRWFKSEHREVSARTWKNPKVKSRANCGACHRNAESGEYSEHDVKIPK